MVSESHLMILSWPSIYLLAIAECEFVGRIFVERLMRAMEWVKLSVCLLLNTNYASAPCSINH